MARVVDQLGIQVVPDVANERVDLTNDHASSVADTTDGRQEERDPQLL